MAPMKVCTFDCYGTLVDWEGGAAAYLYALAQREGAELEPGWAMRNRWEEIQFEILHGGYYVPYKQVLGLSLQRWAEDRGITLRDGDEEGLVLSMRSWQPFPDTRPALRQVREQGVRLVIISNTDRDIIEHTLRHLEVPFDDVITAEDCGAYKPSDTVFAQALERIGESPSDILHVAFGYKYDIGPAQRHGMGTAWVNRHVEQEPGEDNPDHEWRDLWGLAELAGGPGPGIP
jgi:2-haloalkanoic acid dehalogenase type II